jgi:hypothetical protein
MRLTLWLLSIHKELPAGRATENSGFLNAICLPVYGKRTSPRRRSRKGLTRIGQRHSHFVPIRQAVEQTYQQG